MPRCRGDAWPRGVVGLTGCWQVLVGCELGCWWVLGGARAGVRWTEGSMQQSCAGSSSRGTCALLEGLVAQLGRCLLRGGGC